jgi:ABC-type sugar transport system permease subunit
MGMKADAEGTGTKRGLLQAPTFVGLGNYADLLGDSRFWHSLLNTTIYALGSIFVILPIALLLALAIDAPQVRFKQIFRVGIFLPYYYLRRGDRHYVRVHL